MHKYPYSAPCSTPQANFLAHVLNVCCGCLQSLFIAILSGAGVIKTIEDSKNLQNFLIACEMLPAAIFMLWAFPYTDYKTSGETPCFAFCLQEFIQHWLGNLSGIANRDVGTLACWLMHSTAVCSV